jgi:hypothetical protein
MASGVGDVILLHPKTPDDVLEYYRDGENSMVGYGARTSYLENFMLVPHIEQQWKTFWAAKKADLALESKRSGAEVEKRSAAGYEKEYWAFVNDHWPERFASMAEFGRAKDCLS